MFQRILIPTDGSPISEAAAQAAIAFARGYGSELVTLSAEGVLPDIDIAARRTRCDLIFMGSHGRRGLGRLLAGNVTQRVLADAPALAQA